jgi:hypothetical protein
MARPTRPRSAVARPAGEARSRFPIARQATVAIATVLIALAAMSNALGNTVGRAYPILASRQLGADPNIRLKAELEANRNGDLRGLTGIARASLARQALNPLPLAVIGVANEQNGQPADRYMALSDQMSRRTSLAQFWLLEKAVASGDVPGVLNRYDILLSLSSNHWAVLLPILDAAVDDPAITREFAKHLRTRRTWTENFFTYMLNRSAKPERLGRLVLLSGGVDHARALGLNSGRLFAELTDAGRVSLLRALYLTDPAADRALLTNPLLIGKAFNPALAPITWELPASSSTAVFPERRGNRYALHLMTDPDSSGRALRKLLFLTPGRYQLGFSIETIRIAPEASATWSTKCMGSPANALTHPVNLSRSGRDRLTFPVPAGCRAVVLELTVGGGNDQSGTEFLVDGIGLRRIGA